MFNGLRSRFARATPARKLIALLALIGVGTTHCAPMTWNDESRMATIQSLVESRTLVIDHSDNKDNAAPTWKKSFGHHPLLAFLDRPEIAGGEALAGLLRAGNAGSNTAADHITVLEQALASLPPDWRPGPHPGAPRVVVRSDSAGATHAFAQACSDHGAGFSFGAAHMRGREMVMATIRGSTR